MQLFWTWFHCVRWQRAMELTASNYYYPTYANIYALKGSKVLSTNVSNTSLTPQHPPSAQFSSKISQKLINKQSIHGSISGQQNTWYRMDFMIFGIGSMTGHGILLVGLRVEHYTQVLW